MQIPIYWGTWSPVSDWLGLRPREPVQCYLLCTQQTREGRFRNPRGSEREPPAPRRFKVEAEPCLPAPPTPCHQI